jgi:hypothetical protein
VGMKMVWDLWERARIFQGGSDWRKERLVSISYKVTKVTKFYGRGHKMPLCADKIRDWKISSNYKIFKVLTFRGLEVYRLSVTLSVRHHRHPFPALTIIICQFGKSLNNLISRFLK